MVQLKITGLLGVLRSFSRLTRSGLTRRIFKCDLELRLGMAVESISYPVLPKVIKYVSGTVCVAEARSTKGRLQTQKACDRRLRHERFKSSGYRTKIGLSRSDYIKYWASWVVCLYCKPDKSEPNLTAGKIKRGSSRRRQLKWNIRVK